MLTRLPPGPSGSTIAGILLFGLIARNAGAICSPLVILTGKTWYGSPISSSATLILRPFGVFQVWSSIVIFCYFPAKTPISSSPEPQGLATAVSKGRPRVPTVLTAQHRLWNVCPSADRLRPQPAPRAQRLVQISLPRPPCRNHSQTFVRTRRDHAGFGPQKRVLLQSQADHVRSRRRRIARGIDLRGAEGRRP